MRACRTLPTLLGLALAMGAVQASSQKSALRISMTIVDRCDVSSASIQPSVDCSAGVPWTVTPPVASTTPSLVADGTSARHFPVPHSGPVDESRVTTIVF